MAFHGGLGFRVCVRNCALNFTVFVTANKEKINPIKITLSFSNALDGVTQDSHMKMLIIRVISHDGKPSVGYVSSSSCI